MDQMYFCKSEIIDGKKIKAQDLMFADAKTKGYTFPYSCDNVYPNCKKGSKKFNSFNNIDAFLEYEKTLQKSQLNMYEMLTDELVEIYDIDGDYTKSSFLNDDGSRISYDRVIEDFIEARIDFQDEYYKSVPLSRNNFLIKKTDDPENAGTPKEKISLHIIIRNDMKFKDVKELKKFTQKFKKYASQYYLKFIFDKSIYSNNRNIRMLGHSKAGQVGRNSYRYPDFSLFNEQSNRRLFFASHLIGTEKYYPDDINEDDEFVVDYAADPIVYKSDLANVSCLVDLILECTASGKLSICDSEIPDKLGYDDWQKLVYTIFNCVQDELPRTIRSYFNKLFPYYRHSSTLEIENTWNHMSNYIGTYENLTIKSLHYFARQNLRYKEVFPDELKAHKEFYILHTYKKLVKKANKTLESGLQPITYIHEFPRLVQLSENNIYSLEYFHNIINAVCCNICNGGKNAIYAYTKDFDKSSQKDTSNYTINKYKTLNSVGGFLNICVRLIHPEFEKDFNLYKLQQEEIAKGVKIKKNDILECPQLFAYQFVTEDKVYQKSIISTMFTDNLFKTYRKAVFEPYLLEQKLNKDCLNLFTGFPHKNVLTSEKVNSTLYENSLVFKNFKDKLCNGVKEPSSFEYVDNYIAHMIQKPSERPDSMIILSGKQGTGKDLFISFIESMIGQENVVHIDKMESLLKNFNSSIAKKLLTKVNEISDKGIHIDKHDQLKEKITCKYLTIEPKGFDSYQLDHVSRYIGFTNKDNILTVEESDRRFMMIKTKNDMANNIPYHTEIKAEMDNLEMIKSAFYYYATKDISNYSTRVIPTTKYKNDEKINSLPYSLKFLYNLYNDTLKDSLEKYEKHAEDIYVDFINWNIKVGNTKHTLRINMVKDFERLGLKKKRIKINGERKEGFDISYDILEKRFQKYLNDLNLILPKN